MTSGSFWEQLMVALGLDEPGGVQTLARVIQVFLLVLLTIVLSRWARGRIDRATRTNPSFAGIGPIASRVVALTVYAIGITVILALLGANWTILATVLGAATLGISLSFQDVGKNLVDGVYVLVERPYRPGDRVRIGTAEGRVEEIGIRMTRLRTESGELISIPNNLVFTSVIENSSVDMLERQRFAITGIVDPPLSITRVIEEALAGVPHRSPRAPVVSVVAANPQGVDLEVTVEHPPRVQIAEQVIARLRERFPEATISTKSGPDGA